MIGPNMRAWEAGKINSAAYRERVIELEGKLGKLADRAARAEAALDLLRPEGAPPDSTPERILDADGEWRVGWVKR